MSRQSDRDSFIATMARENVPLHVAQRLLRYSATLHRLAEAACNGDWPADNGERKVEPCSRCQAQWVRSSMVKSRTHTVMVPDRLGVPRERPALICKDCRTEELVGALLQPYGITPHFHGDPRGAVLRLEMPSGLDKGWGGVSVG